jgi:hypothetical protein
LPYLVDLFYLDVKEIVETLLDEIVALLFRQVDHCLIFGMNLLEIAK